MADQPLAIMLFNPDAGCADCARWYGHPVVQTPRLSAVIPLI